MCLMRCTTVPAVGAGMAWQRGLYGPKGGGILVGLSKMVGEQERSRYLQQLGHHNVSLLHHPLHRCAHYAASTTHDRASEFSCRYLTLRVLLNGTQVQPR